MWCITFCIAITYFVIYDRCFSFIEFITLCRLPGHYKVITERTRHLIRYASREELSEAICNKYHVADDKSNRKDIPDGSFRVEEAMAERHYSSKKAAARHKGLRTNLGQDGGTM